MQSYYTFGSSITPSVKKIIIFTSAVYILQLFGNIFAQGVIENTFGIHHIGFAHQFKLWQPFTYMFLHGNFLHIFFNMFALWMFGSDLEDLFGSKNFMRFYLYSGVGAGLCIALMNAYIFEHYEYNPITIGASGAIYALLLAYGMIWPNREVLLYFLFPIKMKYLVLIFGAIEFFGTLASASGAGGGISHIGHFGGLVTGFILLKTKFWYKKKEVFNPFNRLLRSYRLAQHRKRIEDRIKAKEIIDTLLDKITRYGFSSLTKEEKQALEWARKHYYPDNNDIIH
ncbi:MAG: rhomboid family intramembrane serine protease [Spirochaetes bacterium]|nr:rhomboid family intramembrane serine protease [Spirochaetota bacterium]